jgi:putative phosphoesterase
LSTSPKRIIDALSGVGLIIHAGDFTDPKLLTDLKQLKEVKAVHGNMDSRQLRSILPVKEVFETDGKRIGITHGSGAPWGIEKLLGRLFESDLIDIVVYGHTHRSQNKVINDILFFNPGKAAHSFGVVTIDGEAKGEVISSR